MSAAVLLVMASSGADRPEAVTAKRHGPSWAARKLGLFLVYAAIGYTMTVVVESIVVHQ